MNKELELVEQHFSIAIVVQGLLWCAAGDPVGFSSPPSRQGALNILHYVYSKNHSLEMYHFLA